MTKWVEYTGSDEQIEELKNAVNGLALRTVDYDRDFVNKGALKDSLHLKDFERKEGRITHYLICNPHPLADMIGQQARTGQEVWVKEGKSHARPFIYETNTPNWNMKAEYSFTEFKD